jgi:pimeloyl-ACP methyl ester carboxylesterase
MVRFWTLGLAAALALALAMPATAAPIPKAIYTDPVRDAISPPSMEVIHVPSGGVEINGIVYTANGPGPHPTLVFYHGLPGNEKNLDLAQAVRRAGWNAVMVNYRGSWGSLGTYSFGGNLEDARAILAFVRDPANATKLKIDPKRIAIGGHSMGGWVASHTLAQDDGVLGAVIYSAGDFGGSTWQARASDANSLAKMMDSNRESLAGVTGQQMAEEIIAHQKEWALAGLAPKLASKRLYVLYSDDFVKADSVDLIKAVKAAGGRLITEKFVPTDHSWSDKRIELQALVIGWLEKLPARAN